MKLRHNAPSHISPALTGGDDDGHWSNRSACAQVDPDMMFPDAGDNNRYALALCNGNPKRGIEPCPVRLECLADALKSGDNNFGIRGGLTAQQRRAFATTGQKPEKATPRIGPKPSGPVACRHCLRTFGRPVDLSQHVRKTHPGETYASSRGAA